jgi:hypothetical protein
MPMIAEPEQRDVDDQLSEEQTGDVLLGDRLRRLGEPVMLVRILTPTRDGRVIGRR